MVRLGVRVVAPEYLGPDPEVVVPEVVSMTVPSLVQVTRLAGGEATTVHPRTRLGAPSSTTADAGEMFTSGMAEKRR